MSSYALGLTLDIHIKGIEDIFRWVKPVNGDNEVSGFVYVSFELQRYPVDIFQREIQLKTLLSSYFF